MKGLFHSRDDMSCKSAQALMSAFIDSMATANEASRLESHLEYCDACRRQLQSFISVRNLLARVEQPAPPEDLVLETRVKLSQARYSNYAERLENRITLILKPVLVPAFFGVSLTALFFSVLFGSLVSQGTVMAKDRSDAWSGPTIASYKPVRTTDRTMQRLRFAVVDVRGFDDPVAIELHVSGDGKVVSYQIIEGEQTPEIDTMLKELLYYAQFSPATALGKPVDSKVILSFVAVRS
jgi:hypothetical protein